MLYLARCDKSNRSAVGVEHLQSFIAPLADDDLPAG